MENLKKTPNWRLFILTIWRIEVFTSEYGGIYSVFEGKSLNDGVFNSYGGVRNTVLEVVNSNNGVKSLVFGINNLEEGVFNPLYDVSNFVAQC